MKNVIKKAFSLLLVSVVAVSMFSFITPNRVDAKVELSDSYVQVDDILFAHDADAKPGYYTIKFFGIDGKLLAESSKFIKYNDKDNEKWQKEKYYLPLWTTKIEFKAITPKARNYKQTMVDFTAIPDLPRSNAGPEKIILSIEIQAYSIKTYVESYYMRSGREGFYCTIFNYISETV